MGMPDYGKLLPELETDIASDHFADAWNLAVSNPMDNSAYSKSLANDGGISAGSYDPLTALLESGKGVQALDPNKKWTQQEMQQFYQAAGQHWRQQGVLGQNPYGLWGDQGKLSSDAATNFSTSGDNSAPDLARFAGASPRKSFLDKYGGDLASLALAVVAPYAVGALAPALGGGVLGGAAAGGLVGAGEGAIIDTVTGQPITASGLLKSAAPGALSAGLGASGASTAERAVASTALQGVTNGGKGLVQGAVSQLGNFIGNSIYQGAGGVGSSIASQVAQSTHTMPGNSPGSAGQNMADSSSTNNGSSWIAQLLGAAGNVSQMQAGNTQSAAQRNAITGAGNTYNMSVPGFTGAGGITTSPFSPGSGGSFNVNLGQGLNTAFGNGTNLLNSSYQNIQNQGPTQAPTGTQAYLQSLLGQNNQLTQAGSSQLNNPLIGQAYGQAGNLLNSANSTYNSAYQNALNPAMQQLNYQQGLQTNANNNLQFEQGRLGTSGGALQTQAMAQGFGLADLQAQQNAVSQANSAMQTNYLGANIAGNIGSSALGQGANILGQGLSLGSNIGNSIANQNAQIDQLKNSNLMTQLGLANGAGSQLQGINNMGLSNADMALKAYTDTSGNQNAALLNMIRAGSAMPGNSGTGGFLQNMGNNLSGANGSSGIFGLANSGASQIGQWLQSMFGGSGGSPSSTSYSPDIPGIDQSVVDQIPQPTMDFGAFPSTGNG